MTTSIPESPGSGRTWDYRYCWLRDSYYVLNAFGLLGQFEEREQFVQYLLNVAGGAPELNLAPLYRVDGSQNLEESILENWPGYNGEQPVRIGNGAALHSQHDIYGEMVLALTPIFLDERMSAERSPAALAVDRGTGAKGHLAGRRAGRRASGSIAPNGSRRRSRASCAGPPPTAWRGSRTGMNRRAQPEFHAAADRIRAEVIAQSWNAREGQLRRALRRRRPGRVAAADGPLALSPAGRSAAEQHDRCDSQGPDRETAGCIATA